MPVAHSLESQRGTLVRHLVVRADTVRPFDIVDITATVGGIVQAGGLNEGLVMVQTRHTTTGLLINEHEPLLFEDLKKMFERLAPASAPYAHDDPARRVVNLTPGERRNGHAHCRAALLRASESIMVAGGKMALGRWQRILFVDFDAGQSREISVTLIGA